jgi:DNA-binding NarL/FixJ family response regulator
MNPRANIFIVEKDCSGLVPIMLWLDQFPEFEVFGTTNDNDFMPLIEEIKADVVLLAKESPEPEDFLTTRQIKALNNSPAIVLSYQSDVGAYEPMLANESDGLITSKTSLTEIYDALHKVVNKRRVAQSAANMPMTKAG